MITDTKETIVILGISEKSDRYSYKAAKMLQQHGFHNLYGVAPKAVKVDGVTYVSNLSDVKEAVDTLTLYVNPLLLESMIDEILTLKPRRIIMNPGTETPALAHKAKQGGIEVLEACTLVLLSTGQF